jgi:hypothetical protein
VCPWFFLFVQFSGDIKPFALGGHHHVQQDDIGFFLFALATPSLPLLAQPRHNPWLRELLIASTNSGRRQSSYFFAMAVTLKFLCLFCALLYLFSQTIT